MTPLPHNPLIWVEDLPEDAESVHVRGEHCLCYFTGLFKAVFGFDPDHTWKLICLGNQATEEEAREIVEIEGDLYMSYYWDLERPMYATALASLRSLITANGWKNPVFLRKEK